MDPLHARLEEFAADGYTHVEANCPRCRVIRLRPIDQLPKISMGLTLDALAQSFVRAVNAYKERLMARRRNIETPVVHSSGSQNLQPESRNADRSLSVRPASWEIPKRRSRSALSLAAYLSRIAVSVERGPLTRPREKGKA